MAEGTEPAATGGEQPTVEELMAQVASLTDERDKAIEQSRKWEGRSKSNADKAKRYDELAAQSMTDAEKLDAASKRAEEAEAKLAAYEAEAKRAKDAAEVSEATGVPASLLTETDRKAMEAQAASILAFAQGQPSAPIFKGDGKRPGPAPKDKKDIFFDFIESQM
ncbi:hypothetical protein B5G20_04975 [Collinsella sp. An7]|uniref:hypothetical protein n=1 Tax=Collinsella sp. An7 TaxID=1965651 RepID=UPI000B37AF6D|nr:hypothetical protein [Collinsella sp. An7]OUN47321.1 hypothetical protein B5G20_04975 [Collinsella sp. An7]